MTSCFLISPIFSLIPANVWRGMTPKNVLEGDDPWKCLGWRCCLPGSTTVYLCTEGEVGLQGKHCLAFLKVCDPPSLSKQHKWVASLLVHIRGPTNIPGKQHFWSDDLSLHFQIEVTKHGEEGKLCLLWERTQKCANSLDFCGWIKRWICLCELFIFHFGFCPISVQTKQIFQNRNQECTFFCENKDLKVFQSVCMEDGKSWNCPTTWNAWSLQPVRINAAWVQFQHRGFHPSTLAGSFPLETLKTTISHRSISWANWTDGNVFQFFAVNKSKARVLMLGLVECNSTLKTASEPRQGNWRKEGKDEICFFHLQSAQMIRQPSLPFEVPTIQMLICKSCVLESKLWGKLIVYC